jgi:hypothetical protein
MQCGKLGKAQLPFGMTLAILGWLDGCQIDENFDKF